MCWEVGVVDLEYHGYQAQVLYDAEAQIFYGRIENIRDFVDFECADESEIAQTFYEAVEDYQLVCSEMDKVFDLQVEKSAQNGSF